ncbi:uncharacterized protein BO80DRAFT_189902 [Aspergillus ibericus CBS 121593]|uniref:Uncharacterized protein n=1 Tax=Aspergillus ibericus CBS 121593 TaxID=1448316 RepID=A0A395GTQ7_9EURO|nr:hypothetical protein BO80DRAFT_189902 [Aspergillus ibericus CBS 121593]RAK97483.1 hypothetical protein BO80DRAFT_189902 [Aspergillus ibericus CBS 121593]
MGADWRDPLTGGRAWPNKERRRYLDTERSFRVCWIRQVGGGGISHLAVRCWWMPLVPSLSLSSSLAFSSFRSFTFCWCGVFTALRPVSLSFFSSPLRSSHSLHVS